MAGSSTKWRKKIERIFYLLKLKLQIMHLAVPKHDIFVTILITSDQCFHSIGWIHRPNNLEQVHTNKVPIYILPISNSVFTSIDNIIICVTTKDIYKKENSFIKQNLEHKCVLQSCKTIRRWQRSYLDFREHHCVGDCTSLCIC